MACLRAAVPISRLPRRRLSSIRGKQREDARPTSQRGRGDGSSVARPLTVEAYRAGLAGTPWPCDVYEATWVRVTESPP
jgi:hypothetical protein